MSKLAIIGSRNFTDFSIGYTLTDKYIDYLFLEKKIDVKLVVSGGANGADLFGKKYSRARKLRYKEYPAEWDKYGKRAGMIRNKDIIDECTCAIIFWDGISRGTKNSIDLIMSKGVPYKIVMYTVKENDEWYNM